MQGRRKDNGDSAPWIGSANLDHSPVCPALCFLARKDADYLAGAVLQPFFGAAASQARFLAGCPLTCPHMSAVLTLHGGPFLAERVGIGWQI